MNNAVNPAANPPSAVTPATTSPTAAPVSAENTAPTEDTMQVAPAVTTDTADTTHPQATAEPAAAVTAPSQPVKPHHAHKSLIVKKTSHLSERVVSELKKPAWVVQMGSFKEKSNAHRLVNQLRNSGFKAFTHVVTSPNGAVRTRVYIGPEFKQASALKLSNKVEQEVKLRGYVIPYKPMAL
jgi:DedD protein